MSDSDTTVFVPDLGFRSARGVAMPKQVTETRPDDEGLRVMYLVSTDRGTEVGFEVRDKDREGTCMVGPVDNAWMTTTEIQLRDDSGTLIPRSPRLGQSFGMGMHDYGFFQVDVAFDSIAPDARHVTLEVRGPLGEWDVPVDLVPLSEADAIPQTRIEAEHERRGITVTVVGMAASDANTFVEIEASAPPPIQILAIGARVIRNDADRLVLVDEQGRRFEEIPSRNLSRSDRADGRHTVAMFPALPADARKIAVVVPGVVIKEPDHTLDLDLPVTEPTEMRFGPYPVRIASAKLSDDVRSGPGEPPAHGVELKFGAGRLVRRRASSSSRTRPDRRDGAILRMGTWRRPDPSHPQRSSPRRNVRRLAHAARPNREGARSVGGPLLSGLMAKVIVGMTISLDGFVNDRNGSVERLYPDLAALAKTEVLQEAMANTGAVVMGRRAYEMANGDFTGYEFQVPIFVVTHHPPKAVAKGENGKLSFEFVGDLDSAVQKAKKAAGSRDVTVVGGASTVQQCLTSGLADELHVGIVPVVFGEGLRLFENLGDELVQLETIEVLKSPNRTDIKFRVAK